MIRILATALTIVAASIPAHASTFKVTFTGQVTDLGPDFTPAGSFGAGTSYELSAIYNNAAMSEVRIINSDTSIENIVDGFLEIEFGSGQTETTAPPEGELLTNIGNNIPLSPNNFRPGGDILFFSALSSDPNIGAYVINLFDTTSTLYSDPAPRLSGITSLLLAGGLSPFDQRLFLMVLRGTTSFGTCNLPDTESCIVFGDVQTVSIAAVPLPLSAPLLLAGIGGLFLMRRRRRHA